MLIARWRIEARFGHKQKVIESLKKWNEEIMPQIGMQGRSRMITGSIGALESTIEQEIQIESLKELEDAWNKMAKIPAHATWSKEIEPHVVSGTPHWQVFRVV